MSNIFIFFSFNSFQCPHISFLNILDIYSFCGEILWISIYLIPKNWRVLRYFYRMYSIELIFNAGFIHYYGHLITRFVVIRLCCNGFFTCIVCIWEIFYSFFHSLISCLCSFPLHSQVVCFIAYTILTSDGII